MSDGNQANVFIATASGKWAFGHVDDIPGLAGERIAVVCAPMT